MYIQKCIHDKTLNISRRPGVCPITAFNTSARARVYVCVCKSMNKHSVTTNYKGRRIFLTL